LNPHVGARNDTLQSREPAPQWPSAPLDDAGVTRLVRASTRGGNRFIPTPSSTGSSLTRWRSRVWNHAHTSCSTAHLDARTGPWRRSFWGSSMSVARPAAGQHGAVGSRERL